MEAGELNNDRLVAKVSLDKVTRVFPYIEINISADPSGTGSASLKTHSVLLTPYRVPSHPLASPLTLKPSALPPPPPPPLPQALPPTPFSGMSKPQALPPNPSQAQSSAPPPPSSCPTPNPLPGNEVFQGSSACTNLKPYPNPLPENEVF